MTQNDRLATAPVGVLGRPFFSPTPALRHYQSNYSNVIISGAPFSSIFNHLRYSLNTSHKAFRHVTTAREMRRPACEVLSSLDALRLPSPVGRVSLKIHKSNSAHHSRGTQFEALK